MKNYLKNLLVASMTCLVIAGCDPSEVVEDFTTVTVDTKLPQYYSITVGEVGPTEITLSKTFKGSENEDIAQFESRVDSYGIDSLTLKIVNYEGPESPAVSMDNAAIEFQNAAQEQIIAPVTLINADHKINLLEYSHSGALISYEFEPSMAQTIAASFREDNEVTIKFTASVDGQPVSFDIEATLYVHVTGSLLQMQP